MRIDAGTYGNMRSVDTNEVISMIIFHGLGFGNVELIIIISSSITYGGTRDEDVIIIRVLDRWRVFMYATVRNDY